MTDDLFVWLWERARVRTPRGGLVAITEAEVAQMPKPPPEPIGYNGPRASKTTLFGTEAIVIDRPPR